MIIVGAALTQTRHNMIAAAGLGTILAGFMTTVAGYAKYVTC